MRETVNMPEGRELFVRILPDAFKNLLFFSLALAAIFAFAPLVPTLARVAFWGLAIIIGLSVIKQVVLVALGLIVLPRQLGNPYQRPHVAWEWAASGVRLSESLLLALGCWLVYLRLRVLQ